MKKVLVTGSKGQLGTECLNVFSTFANVVGIDLPQFDLSERQQCFSVLEKVSPNIIINCAAYTAVDACESDPSCWKANRDIPGHLAHWTEMNEAFLIHVSTDYVFEGNRPLFEAYHEGVSTCPTSIYGKSKLAGEQIITEKTERYAILRTAWLYGGYGNNFLRTMLRLTLQDPSKEFRVVNDQWGSPTWALTLARQIRAVVEEKVTGIFHASSEGHCTWYDLACRYLEELNIKHNFIPCDSSEFPTLARRPRNSILENCRFKELGINQFTDWENELENFSNCYGKSMVEELKLD
jgi:dTDP-4-dehydrorhamnose reductase